MTLKWYFIVNRNEETTEIQFLDDEGKSKKTDIFNKKDNILDIDLNYKKIVDVINKYEYGTGDYFNENGDILDFMGNIKKEHGIDS